MLPPILPRGASPWLVEPAGMSARLAWRNATLAMALRLELNVKILSRIWWAAQVAER